MKTKMINRLLSILLLATLSSIATALKLNQTPNAYFIIRSEWDDRCVAYLNNDLVLNANCNLAQSVWESTKGQTTNVALKNYFGGKYLNFVAGQPVPKMIDQPIGNSRFNFQVVHPRNRRWPNNRSYWGVTYHVVQNTVTRLCLMVAGDVMRQLNCNPSKPEHLSFEQVPFNPTWVKSPERIAEEVKKAAPPAPPVIPPPPVVKPVIPPPPPVVIQVLPPPPPVVVPVIPPPPVVVPPSRRKCTRSG